MKSRESIVKASHYFVLVLALVSIAGFLGIVGETLFDYNIQLYVEAFLMIIVGIGFVVEGEFTKLGRIKREGMTPKNFTQLTTVIIGLLALISGIFSFPGIRVENPGFLAMKGIVSIICIAFIIIQTWVIERGR